MSEPLAAAPLRQLFLGIDVSSSVRPYIPEIHFHLTAALERIHQHGPYELAIYLFNWQVLPFPSEVLAGVRPYPQAFVPTLSDLRRSVAGGTALWDMQDWLIDEAARHDHPDRRSIILTDGWERSSVRTTLERLRAKAQHARDWLDISLVGFVDARTLQLLAGFAQDLDLPRSAWAFSEHQNDRGSISESIEQSSLDLVRMALRRRGGEGVRN